MGDSSWFGLLIQAGGAVTVCGMFIAFLIRQRVADDKRIADQQKFDAARDKAFLDHLELKDKFFAEQMDKQLAYLKERDAQSKDIAMNGHDALRDVATAVNDLRELIIKGK